MLIGNGRTRSTCCPRTISRLLVVDPGLDRAVDGLDEVLAVIAEMKTKQIVAQQALEQLFLPGKDAKRLAVRPGNVPELGDDQVGIALLEIPRQQRKVVVLDEHECRPITGLFEHRIAEQCVDVAVESPSA